MRLRPALLTALLLLLPLAAGPAVPDGAWAATAGVQGHEATPEHSTAGEATHQAAGIGEEIRFTAEHAGDEHAGEGHEGEHAGAHHGEHLELPHLIMVLRNFGPLSHNEAFIEASHKYENIFYALVAGLVLTFIALRIYRNQSDIPGRLQAFGEILVEQVLNITITMMGERAGRKYAPFVATIFVYLVAMNYSGLIPLGKAPTSTFINNISIGLCVFLYVQYTGIRRNGVLGYLHHLAGSPKDAIGWMLSPLMFFLEVFGEIVKPFSLSLRLFGNIFGEDTLLAVFALLGVVSLSVIGSPVGLPLHVPFLFLSLLLGMIQALVFSLLAAVYIALMLPHDDHHDEEAHA